MAAAQYVSSNRQRQSMGRLPIYVYVPHCSSSSSSSLQWIPNKHSITAICCLHGPHYSSSSSLQRIPNKHTSLLPSTVCMDHTILPLLLLLYSGSQTNTPHYRHLLSVWTTLFFFFFFTADPKQTHSITAICCLHGPHYSSSSSLQRIPNKHTALPPSAVCMDHTILPLLLLYSGSQTNTQHYRHLLSAWTTLFFLFFFTVDPKQTHSITAICCLHGPHYSSSSLQRITNKHTALPPSAVCMDHTILPLLLLYSGSQTNTQHYRHLLSVWTTLFFLFFFTADPKQTHSITAICCLHGPHYSSSSSSLQRIPNKHKALPPSAVCMGHTILPLLLLLLYSGSQTNTHHYAICCLHGPHYSSSSSSLQRIPNKHTALPPSAVCMDHTILPLLLYSGSQTNTQHYRHLLSAWTTLFFLFFFFFFFTADPKQTQHYRHLMSAWSTLFFLFFFTAYPKQTHIITPSAVCMEHTILLLFLLLCSGSQTNTHHYSHLLSAWITLFFFFFFFAVDPKQTHIITAICCLHGSHYSSSSASLQRIPNKHTALPPSAVCMDHTILPLLLFLYSGSQTNTQHYRHLLSAWTTLFFFFFFFTADPKQTHSITSICCLHGPHYSSSSLQRIPNKHTALPPSAVCMDHTILLLLLLYSGSQTNTQHYRHLLSAWTTLFFFFCFFTVDPKQIHSITTICCLYGPHYSSSFSFSLQWIPNKHSITVICFFTADPKQTHSITSICCLHGPLYSSSSLQRIQNKHTALPPSAVCMEHTIGAFPLHGTVRFGTARYGSVRVGLRFHCSLVPL